MNTYGGHLPSRSAVAAARPSALWSEDSGFRTEQAEKKQAVFESLR